MTLMDAAALVKELEEELGVSAAAPMAVAGPAAGPAAAAKKRPSSMSFSQRPAKRRFKSSKSSVN